MLADIFLGKLKTQPLKNSIDNMRFYRPNVDDIFVILEPHQDIKSITEEFNLAHSSIMFTLEVECSNMIHFLDVQLLRCPNGELERSVHRKPTWTDQYTHFHSFVPLIQRRNLVRCLFNRANKICSSSTLEAERKFLKTQTRLFKGTWERNNPLP